MERVTPFEDFRRLQLLAETERGSSRYYEMLSRVIGVCEEIGLEEFLRDVAGKASGLSTLPYRDFLTTEEWKQTRKEALERANNACQICNSRDELQVHHRSYDGLPLESLDDLTVLCDPCHALFSEHGRLAEAA